MTRATAARTRSRPETLPRAVHVPVDRTALLLIDVINDLAFEGSESLVEQAEPMAARLGRLKRRATQAGVPAIHINDNFGRWRSDFRQTVAHCTSPRAPGRRVSQRLRPTQRDYFVLKPKHSGFFDTTLDTLLGALKIRRVIGTGNHALRQIRTVLKGNITDSARLNFRRGRRVARARGRRNEESKT